MLAAEPVKVLSAVDVVPELAMLVVPELSAVEVDRDLLVVVVLTMMS